MECIWFLQFRLTQSGICNCMYLVESHGQRQYSLPISTLLQAAANTQFIDRFTVKFTNNSHDTVVYLSTFTKVLARKFSVSTISCLLFFVLTNCLLFHPRPSLWEQVPIVCRWYCARFFYGSYKKNNFFSFSSNLVFCDAPRI